jgi:hypothetical protein
MLFLFLMTLGITVLTKFLTLFFAPGLTGSPFYSAFTIQTKIFSTIYSIFGIAVPIGSATWLSMCNRGSSTKWMWTLLGLFPVSSH